MTADIGTTLASWSTSEASNAPTGATAISTNLDDNLRMVQAVVRTLAAANTIASAGTTDLSTINEAFVTVSGTTTITALGTVSAGIWKVLTFSGALTLTHNATSLILPSGASITTTAGDTALFVSLGSGNWRCIVYQKSDGTPVVSGVRLNALQAANGAGSLSNADYAQVWQWAITTASKSALTIKESAASSGSGAYLLDVQTVANSTANPLRVKARADSVSDQILVSSTGVITLRAGSSSAASSTAPALTIQGGSGTGSTTNAGGVTINGGECTSDNNGGDVTITGGLSTSGAPGSVTISGGYKTGATGTRYDGGWVTIAGGSAIEGGTGSANGGSILLRVGYKGGSGVDGNITFANPSDVAILKVIGKEEHFVASGSAAPTISAGGGTGRTIAGRDQAFVVTMGTGSPTSVTVQFANQWTTAPVVTCLTSKTGVTLSLTAVSTSSVQITSSAAWSSSDKLHVICMGYE